MNLPIPFSQNQTAFFWHYFDGWFNVTEGSKRGGKNALIMMAYYSILEKHPSKIYLIAGFRHQLDERRLAVRQNRGKYNCARTPEVQAFEGKWLAWVRAGAPRDRDGRPVLAQRCKEGAA